MAQRRVDRVGMIGVHGRRSLPGVPPLARSLGLAMALGLALLGCREEDQDRILVHEKGVYQGSKDQAIPEPTLDQLRQRARSQQF